MSRSRRTRPPRVVAEERAPQTREGERVLPRVVEREPRRGDSHPLSARWLRKALRERVPPEYLLGLKRIELRARESAEVGEPFGCYLSDERVIRLFSLPMSWETRSTYSDSVTTRSFGIRSEALGGGRLRLTWPNPTLRLAWFYLEVFAHELGHHHQVQYRHRRKLGDRIRQELVADLHGARFYRRTLREIREAREG